MLSKTRRVADAGEHSIAPKRSRAAAKGEAPATPVAKAKRIRRPKHASPARTNKLTPMRTAPLIAAPSDDTMVAEPLYRVAPRGKRIWEEFDTLASAVMLIQLQLAELLGYSGASVGSWRRNGLGPKFISVNGRPRTTVGHVREWLAGLPDPTTRNRKEKAASASTPTATKNHSSR